MAISIIARTVTNQPNYYEIYVALCWFPVAYFAEQINLRGIFFLFFSLLVNNPPCLDIVYKTVGKKCIATIGLDNRDFGVLNYYYCFFFYTVPV